MAYALAPCFGAGQQFFDDSGVPLAGGLLYTYSAGTTTPAATYTNYLGSAVNANPIVLDAAGRIPEEIWLTATSAYKFTLKTSTFVEIWTKDYISVYTPASALTSLGDASSAALGDALVAFKQSNSSGILSGAVAGTVHTKLQEYVSVKDFGAVGDGVTDDSAALVLAIKSNRSVHFPAGTYLVKSKVALSSLSNFEMIGDGIGSSIILADQALGSPMIEFSSCSHVRVAHITFDAATSSAMAGGGHEALRIVKCTAPTFEHCEFKNHPVMGIYMINTGQFQFRNNRFYYPTPRGDITNFNINCGYYNDSTEGYNRDGVFTGNYSYGSQCLFFGKFITISNNVFTGSKYGSGLTTGAGNPATRPEAVNYGPYQIASNISYANVGYDKDGTDVMGIEADGWNNVITGNAVFQNGGNGIRLYGQNSCVVGNYCGGNGTNITTLHPAIANEERSGIFVYQWKFSGTLYGASYSLISGNKCSDLGASTQLYGYYEYTNDDGVTGLPWLTGMTVVGNQFGENVTAPVYLHSHDSAYDLEEWVAWTPTISCSGGATISTTSVSAQYRLASRQVFFNIVIVVNTTTMTSEKLYVSLPTVLGGATMDGAATATNATVPWSVAGYIDYANQRIVLAKDNTTSAVGNGATLVISGSYRTE